MIYGHSYRSNEIITGTPNSKVSVIQQAKINVLLETLNKKLIDNGKLYDCKPYKLRDIYRYLNKYMEKYNIQILDEGIDCFIAKVKENDYIIPKEGL